MAHLLWNKFILALCLTHGLVPNISQGTDTNGCVCPGDTLTYSCSVSGTPEGFTVWTGTAFNCVGGQIILRHNGFPTVIGDCNNGAIVARSVSVEGVNYTSQLSVNVTSDTSNKTIMCVYEVNGTQVNWLMTKIPTLYEGPISPPNNLHISVADFVSRYISFNWNPVAPDLHYNIISSNCGSCPTTTTNTTVTCTDVPVNDTQMTCTLAVQTVACGVQGNSSTPIYIQITGAKQPQGSTSALASLVTGVLLLIIAILIIVGFIVYVMIIRRSSISLRCKQRAKQHDSNIPRTLNMAEQSIRNPACEDKISPPINFQNNGVGHYHSNINPSSEQVPPADAQRNKQFHTTTFTITNESQYSSLNRCTDNGDTCVDNPPAKPPRRRSSVNKPGSMSVTVDYHIYDRTSHF